VYCYDSDDNKTGVIAGDGDASPATCGSSVPYETTYVYDSVGEMVSQTTPATAADPTGGTTTYTYDATGNQLTVIDPAGVTSTYAYDPAGARIGVTYSGSAAHAITYSYDVDTNKIGMTDASGTSSYTYDAFGELTSATNGNGQTVSYSYDSDGDATGTTYPLPSTATWASTDTVGYAYDHADQLSSVKDFTGEAIDLTDSADGHPTSEMLGSTGDTVATSYDNTGATSSITVANSSGTTLQSFSYNYAPDGSLLTEGDSPSSAGTSQAYAYTAQGQVSTETANGSTYNYGYDQSGSLTSLPGNAIGTYDDDGELTSSTSPSGVATNYAYNADGQRTGATTGGTSTETATWNGANELIGYDDSSGDMTAAIYDGDGLRASTTSGSGGTEQYVWNTMLGNPQLIMDAANAYVYTEGSVPAEQVNLSTGAITYLTSDLIGSVRGAVSNSGSLVGTVDYDAWGNVRSTSEASAISPFGYAGGYTDSDGLLYLINRYYDPATGQFVSVDPLVSQTLQPYSYGNGDPVTNTDPTGQIACGTDAIGGPPDPWLDVFGGCIFGEGLYVTGATAGFAGWRDFCGWHYEFKFYWGGRLHVTVNGPNHGGCNWNNNGNYNYIFRFILVYPENGTFEALLWSTGADDRFYMQGEIAESVHG
jgi:RHS repeat-associated protein